MILDEQYESGQSAAVADGAPNDNRWYMLTA